MKTSRWKKAAAVAAAGSLATGAIVGWRRRASNRTKRATGAIAKAMPSRKLM